MLIRAASSKEAIISVEQKRVISEDSSNAKKKLQGRKKNSSVALFLLQFYLPNFVLSSLTVSLVGHNLRCYNGGG